MLFKKNSYDNHLKEIKDTVNNLVILDEQKKRRSIPSFANSIKCYAFSKIHKPSIALGPIFPINGTTF